MNTILIGGARPLRRVRKEDVKPAAPAIVDPMEVCLLCWKNWMCKADTDLGPKGMRSMAGDGDGYGNDDTAQSRRDNEIAEATHAMIHSLPPAKWWAIYRKCGVSTVWRYPHLEYLVVALEASQALEQKLRENVATATLFE